MGKEIPMLAVTIWKAVEEEREEAVESGKHLGKIFERRGTGFKRKW